MTAFLCVVGFIAFVLVVYLIRSIPSFVSSDISSRELFVCQSCGHEFYPKWQEMVFGRWTLSLRGEVRLRCPHCQKKEWCHEKRK